MDINLNKKICNICNICKSLSEFGKNSSYKDGYRNTCKDCRNEKLRESYDLNRRKVNEFDKLLKEMSVIFSDAREQFSRSTSIKDLDKVREQFLRRENDCYQRMIIADTSCFVDVNFKTLGINPDSVDMSSLEVNIKGLLQQWIFKEKTVLINPDEIHIQSPDQKVVKVLLPHAIRLSTLDKANIVQLLRDKSFS